MLLVIVTVRKKKSETLVRVLKFAKDIADSSRILSQIISVETHVSGGR